MAWQIRNRSSNDKLAIDATSYAARVTPYDSRGINRGKKQTYCASTDVPQSVAVTVTKTFSSLTGSATKTVRLQRVVVSGTAAALATVPVVLKKTSAAATGGTPVTMTEIPFVTGATAVTAVAQMFSAAPTVGTLIGAIDSRLITFGITGTSVYDGSAAVFDFTNGGEMESPTLSGVAETFELHFGVAAPSTPVVNVAWYWTEE